MEKQNLIAQQTHQGRAAKEKKDTPVEEHGYRQRNKGRVDDFPTTMGVKEGSFENLGQIFPKLSIVVSEMIWLPISEL